MSSGSTPAVTVAMPVRNGMPYLRETLASVDAQTFRDFEVLLWDNGSDDGTVEEARSWIPGKLPGQVFAGEPLSLGESRATLMTRARTPYVAILDADDLWMPEKLERQVAAMEHGKEVLVGTNAEFIDSTGKIIPGQGKMPIRYSAVLNGLLASLPFVHSSFLLRREETLQVGNYRMTAKGIEGTFYEDYDLALRLASAGLKMRNLPEALCHYRIHDASTIARDRDHNEAWIRYARTLSINAPGYVNLPRETMRRLLYREDRLAWPKILHIADQLCQRDGRSVRDRLRDGRFRGAVFNLCHPKDRTSRFLYYLRALQPRLAVLDALGKVPDPKRKETV